MSLKLNESIQAYTNLDRALGSGEGFIYVKKNNLSFEAIPLDNLFGLITDIGDTTFNSSYIPQDLIKQIDMGPEVPKLIYKRNEYNIAYYSPYLIDTKENLLTIIKLFNSLPSIQIALYTTFEIHRKVKEFANDNLIFFPYSKPEDVTIKASMIITHGYSARGFIQQLVPTLIIGSSGLGGWVTPDNIHYFIKNNFNGRLGGEIGESISHKILVDELLEIKEEENLNFILSRNAKIIKEYVKTFSLDETETVIKSFTSIHKKFNDIEGRYLLKPKLASNVELIKVPNQYIIVKRQEINDVLFNVPNDDSEFLKDLNGSLSCQEIKDNYGLNDKEFWDILIPLWERKAITFSL